MVKSNLSTRSRTLSERRSSRTREPVDLSTQDQALKADRDSWVPADQHPNYVEEGDEVASTLDDTPRGRVEERAPEVSVV